MRSCDLLSTTPPRVEVRVDERRLSTNVAVRRAGGLVGRAQRIGFIDRHRLGGINLFLTDAGPRMAKIPVLRGVASNLRVALAGAGPEVVVAITGGKVADLVPWEAFDYLMDLDRSEEERRQGLYAPVRLTGTASPYAPTAFDEPMRVAILFGHPDGAFNQAEQEERVLATLAELNMESAGRVAPPTARSSLDLASQAEDRWQLSFAELKPHVVVYFGHGRSGDIPSIRVGPGTDGWMPLEHLVEIVRSGCLMPPFWAFLACSLGEPAPATAVLAGPRAFAILRDNGATAMLAMRAEIRPIIAEMMIRLLIEFLAAGKSIEVAAAHARRAIRHSKRAHAGRLVDWAAPAVWSAAEVISGYTWGGTSSDSSAFLSMQLLRTTTRDLGLGLEGPPPEAFARIARWRTARRIRLIAIAGWSTQTRTEVASTLVAARRSLGSTVVLIELPEGANYPTRLKDWAAGFRRTLTPAIARSDLVRALQLLEELDPQGLQILLSIPDVVVVLSEPPGYGLTEEAAWERILTGPEAAVIVVCERPGDRADRLADWTIDQIDRPYDEASVDALFAKAPASLALLSIINRPIPLEVLGKITKEDTIALVDPRVLIDDPASGVVLVHAARERIHTLGGPERIRTAHATYLRARSEAAVSFRELGDWSEDIRHLIGAGLNAELATFVRELLAECSASWLDTDWIRLGRALERAGSALRGIGSEVILQIASVLLDRQEVMRARFWLESLSCDSELDEARRLAMLSEVWKAETGAGARERMWATLRAALAICEAVPHDAPIAGAATAAHREYEMNLARLQLYFNHDAPAARDTFERLIATWTAELASEPAVARPLAAAMRNLAECLFEFEPFAGQRDSWDAAARLLATALRVAQDHGLMGVDAEVTYSSAKLAEIRSDGEAGHREATLHLNKCSALAKDARHHVLVHIAELRLFRLQVQLGDRRFDLADFRTLVSPLDYLGWHAWAVRFAGQARLWAARRLVETNEIAGAIDLLERNVLALADRPGLSGRSDHTSIARTFAGLTVLDPPGEAWSRFQHLEWAQAWLHERGSPAPERIWSEVV